MKEAELRTRVLMPLFRAMGFRDVRHYHGGPLEVGKDIVMWKPGDLGERINYGVVVKAGKINGRATGRSSAAEVRFQIEQCFGSSYPDIITIEERPVHRCFVVSSGEIMKEATNAIMGVLCNAKLDTVTKFIDGDKLWQLIEEFMPEQSGFEHLHIAHRKLNAKSEYVNVVANTEGALFFEPKSPDILERYPHAFIGNLRFDPMTKHGRLAHEQLTRHVETGVSVKFRRSQCAEFILPEFMRPFVDPNEEFEVHLHSLRGEYVLPMRIAITTSDGTRASLDYVRLESTQVGTDEITFDNASQDVPWTWTIKFDHANRRSTFGCQLEFAGANVKPVLDLVRFTNALARGGELSLENLNTSVSVDYRVPPNTCDQTNSRVIKLLESLVMIQSKTGVLFTVPVDAISAEDVRHIHHFARVCETGYSTFAPQPITSQSTPEQARQALEVFGGGRTSNLYFTGEAESVRLLDVEVPTGRFSAYCDQVYITPEDEAALRAILGTVAPDTLVNVRLTPQEGQDLELTGFQLNRMLMGVFRCPSGEEKWLSMKVPFKSVACDVVRKLHSLFGSRVHITDM